MRLREFSARGAPAGQGLRTAFSSESLPPCSCGPTVLLALRQTPSQKDGNPSTHACGRALDLRPRHGATFRAHNDPGAERLRSILRPLSRVVAEDGVFALRCRVGAGTSTRRPLYGRVSVLIRQVSTYTISIAYERESSIPLCSILGKCGGHLHSSGRAVRHARFIAPVPGNVSAIPSNANLPQESAYALCDG